MAHTLGTCDFFLLRVLPLIAYRPRRNRPKSSRERKFRFFFLFFFHERNAGERICRSIRFDIRLVFSKDTGDFSECVSCEHAWNDTRPIYSPLSESSAFTKNHLDHCERCNRRLAEKSKFYVSFRWSRLLGEKKKETRSPILLSLQVWAARQKVRTFYFIVGRNFLFY